MNLTEKNLTLPRSESIDMTDFVTSIVENYDKYLASLGRTTLKKKRSDKKSDSSNEILQIHKN